MMEGKEGQVRMAHHEREHQTFRAKFSVCLSWRNKLKGRGSRLGRVDGQRRCISVASLSNLSAAPKRKESVIEYFFGSTMFGIVSRFWADVDLATGQFGSA